MPGTSGVAHGIDADQLMAQVPENNDITLDPVPGTSEEIVDSSAPGGNAESQDRVDPGSIEEPLDDEDSADHVSPRSRRTQAHRDSAEQHIISTEDTPAEPAETLMDIHSHPPM